MIFQKGYIPRPSSECIYQDKWDRRSYKELFEASQELRELGDTEIKEALLQDIWASFFKTEPKLIPPSDPRYMLNKDLVERMMQTTDYNQSRLITELDELASAVATVEAGKALVKEIDENDELRKAMKGRGNPGNSPGPAALRRIAKKIMQQASEKTKETADIMAGWGIEPGEINSVPLEDRLKLVERLKHANVSRLADLVGRMRNLCKAREKMKVNKGRDEVHDIILGDDLGRLLPAELAMLKGAKIDFMRRFSEKQLLQYDLKSKEPMGRGPMIILVDRSGSMAGSKIEWAIAITLALVNLAQKQKRRAKAIFFDTDICREVEFAPNEKDIEKLIQVGTMNAFGGTDYNPPIAKAINMVKSQAYKKADIVMISDGECVLDASLKQEILALRAQEGLKTVGVLVGTADAYDMPQWANPCLCGYEFTDDIAAGIFDQVV